MVDLILANPRRSVAYNTCGIDCHQIQLRGFTLKELAVIAATVGVIVYVARK